MTRSMPSSARARYGLSLRRALDWRDPWRPASSRDYAGRFGRGDDATLVIHGGSAAEVVPRRSAARRRARRHGARRARRAGRARAADRRGALAAARRRRPGGPALAGSVRPAGAVRPAQPGARRAHRFTCNLCGTAAVAETQGWPRDTATCPGCGSAARFRGLADLVAHELFGSADPLYALPARPDLAGVGMSDPLPLAALLGRRMGYANTFYHCEPRLDVCAPGEHAGRYDLVVCSEVLEHVRRRSSPRSRACTTCCGRAACSSSASPTAPTARRSSTSPTCTTTRSWSATASTCCATRHPDGRRRSTPIWSSTAAPARRSSCASSPCPTCWRGSTPPGSVDVRVRREPNFAHGVWWPGADGWPITARRPATQSG